MIPKIIHYCWFGKKPLPALAIKCIESWKKFLPDYEIKEWNEDNFDINIVPYTKEAYEAQKYAFVSDYARFWILNKYGGIYFDTDVEVVKSMDDIIARGSFMGCESYATTTNYGNIAPGLGLGLSANHHICREMLDIYSSIHFIMSDGSYNLKTVVEYTTDLFITKGYKKNNEIQNCSNTIIYPKDYFNPMTASGKILITETTYSIHHYAGTWIPLSMKLKQKIIKMCGDYFWGIIQNIRGKN